MFVNKISACDAFVANDGCETRELLHPKNDSVDLPYSLALATVDIGKQCYNYFNKRQISLSFYLPYD
tara:strand:- start:156 stop:356 length:201 start_codon:yes stop_codon:yes gene_type:complete